MPDLTIAVATNGDVPDNQCALKDAVLMAAATGTTDPTAVVALARDFYAFLVNPAGGTAHAPAQVTATPAPETLGAAPLEIGQPVDSSSTPAPAAPPAPAPTADSPSPVVDAAVPDAESTPVAPA
jgi:hypothetical protein